jgi:hypothetical protein
MPLALFDRLLPAARNAPLMAVMGRAVIYTPASTGVPETVQGMFREAHEFEFANAQGVMETSVAPVVRIVEADLSVAMEQDDTLTVDGVAYAVDDVQTSGVGISLLLLSRV